MSQIWVRYRSLQLIPSSRNQEFCEIFRLFLVFCITSGIIEMTVGWFPTLEVGLLSFSSQRLRWILIEFWESEDCNKITQIHNFTFRHTRVLTISFVLNPELNNNKINKMSYHTQGPLFGSNENPIVAYHLVHQIDSAHIHIFLHNLWLLFFFKYCSFLNSSSSVSFVHRSTSILSSGSSIHIFRTASINGRTLTNLSMQSLGIVRTFFRWELVRNE